MPLEVLFIYGLVSRALHVKQLLLHFLISGGAFGAGRGSQRRLSSRSILCVIFEFSNLARVSCFLMLLLVLKATIGLFGKSLESSEDFSMRCQCLVSNLLRRHVGKCGEYIVVKVRCSSASCVLFVKVFLSITKFNSSNASFYGLLSVSSFLHVFDMLLFLHLERSFV